MQMHRRHSWISPFEVQMEISTGSGRFKIKRAVEMWIEFIIVYGFIYNQSVWSEYS